MSPAESPATSEERAARRAVERPAGSRLFQLARGDISDTLYTFTRSVGNAPPSPAGG